MKAKIWDCKIGEIGEDILPPGADYLMRESIRAAYKCLTGREADFVFSGWGGTISESERAVIENREPFNPNEGREYDSGIQSDPLGVVGLGECDREGCERLAIDTRREVSGGPVLQVCGKHTVVYESLEAEHAMLMSMVEKAANTLRQLADFDPDDKLAHPGAVVQAIAKRALTAMREIGGLDG